MKLKYETNYKGYIPILRGMLFLIKNKTLNFPLLGAYILFVSQADFDSRHKNYGIILRDDKELAKEFGCSHSTLYRSRKKLIKKGLLIEENGITKVPNFHVFELSWVKIFAKLPIEIMQSLFVKTIDEIAKEQHLIEKLQNSQLQNDGQSSNVSSKGNVGVSDEDIDFANRDMEHNDE